MAVNLRRSPSPKRRRRDDHSPTRLGGSSHHPVAHMMGPSTPGRASRDYANDHARHHSYGADSTTIHSAFYDVVLQADGPAIDGSHSQPEDLLPRLGPVLLDQSGKLEPEDGCVGSGQGSGMTTSGSGSSIAMVTQDGGLNRPQASASAIAQADTKFERKLNELANLERSYVRRIDALYHDYAIPLRQLARDKDTAIIPLYEAHKVFSNINEILSCNQAFLYELEIALREGLSAARAQIGAILYKHMIFFSCYKEYIGNFDKNMISSLMKGRALKDFVDRTRQASYGIGNSGLAELLMEPVQRIPRYKLLIAELSSYMLRPSDEDQLTLMQKAMTTIDDIAQCEADDKTKKAAALWSFSRNVDGFPPSLISVKREFIDCIDVDDFPLDQAASSNPGLFSPTSTAGPFSPQTPAPANLSSSGRPVPCTLFLFDDRLVIAKRASSATCGRRAVGLEDLTRLAAVMKWNPEGSMDKRVELGFRGVVDLMDFAVTDLGGADFQLVMARPPTQVSGDKWTNRLVRNYTTSDYVNAPGAGGSAPPSSVATHGTPSNLSTVSASTSSGAATLIPGREEKARFLENVFRAQALFKARDRKSSVRVLAVAGSESRGETGRKLVFWNVHSRRSYLAQQHKACVVLHVDLTGQADPIPFGSEHHPAHARVRIYSLDMKNGQCFHTASVKGIVDDDDQPQAMLISDLCDRLQEVAEEARTINDFGPRRTDSILSTPSHRGRSVAQGLEIFRRSLLFGVGGSGGSNGTPAHTRAGSNPGPINDPFGSPSKRTKSSTSRATTDTISSVFSQATSNMRSSTALTSVNGNSVNSRDLLMGAGDDHMMGNGRLVMGSQDLGAFKSAMPAGLLSPRKLQKKKRSSSVGAPDAESMANVISTRYGSHFTARLKDGDEQGSGPGTPSERMSTRPRVQSTPMQDLLQLRASAAADADTIASLKAKVEELERERAVLKPLQTQVRMLTRKVEVLTVLEKDGQLENTELHKAFNEELDGLYEHTQKPESEELVALRLEAKKTKAERNEYSAMVRALKRELELERGEKAVFKAILTENGLL